MLPRRNAKNNAISNIKAFTSKNKTPKKPEKASEKSKAVKHDFVVKNYLHAFHKNTYSNWLRQLARSLVRKNRMVFLTRKKKRRNRRTHPITSSLCTAKSHLSFPPKLLKSSRKSNFS